MTTQIEKDTARSQARAQYESILSLLDALTLEGAARAWLQERCHAELCTLAQTITLDGFRNISWGSMNTEELRDEITDCMSGRFPFEPDGFEFNEDDAREALEADALSVEVRSDWYDPYRADKEDKAPAEFRICLCTGGPAVQIRGELDSDGEPSRAWLEYQDWGTPWKQYIGMTGDEPGALTDVPEQNKLLEYARHFINSDVLSV